MAERERTDRMTPTLETVTRLEAPSMAAVIRDETGLAWREARGTRVWGEDGKEYLDLTAGSGVHNVGHNHPEVVEAIVRQAGTLTHSGWQFPCPPRARLLERLRDLLPFDDPQLLFTVTGSEAVEASLKVARLATGRPAVLSFLGGFHGKTGGSLAVTANPRLRSGVTTVPPDVLRLPFPDAAGGDGAGGPAGTRETIAWIEQLITHPDFGLDGIAGIIVEPIQGSTGMTAPPPGFLAALREMTARHGLLLILDEIFTGFGRTGQLFGFEQDGITPDIVVLGKSLGGGLPISLIAAPASLMRHIPAYKQTSTFSGHPLACAAGLAVLDVIEREQLAANAAARSEQLRAGLERLDGRGARVTVTGRGLMLGVRLEAGGRDASRDFATAFARELQRLGVLCLRGGTYGNVIKITPPLVLSAAEAEMVCDRFGQALEACVGRVAVAV